MLFDENRDKEYRLAQLDLDDNCYTLNKNCFKREILSKINTVGAVNAIVLNFENSIKYYAEKNIDFNSFS